MSEILNLKEFARIGNDMLITLVGVMKNYKEEQLDTEQRDYSKCSATCQFASVPIENKFQMCEQHCPFHVPKKPRVVYVNERHEYNIPKDLASVKFSKSAIKFYLLCHFLHVDSNGFIKYVSIKKVASLLEVTVRTVKNLIRLFQDNGLMLTSKIDSEYINILLPYYHKYHLSRQEGGNGGYLKMDKETLLEFVLKADNVNSLREGLRFYKRTLEDKHQRKTMQSQFSVNDLKRMLPPHLQHQNGIKQTIEGIKPFFDISYNGHFALVKIKEKYDSRLKESIRKGQYKSQLQETLSYMDVSYSDKELNDLIQMSLEYSIDSVIDALIAIESSNSIEWKEIENIGGKVRTYLQMNHLQKISA